MIIMFFLLECCCTQVGFQEVGSILAHFSATKKISRRRYKWLCNVSKYCQYSINDLCVQYHYYTTMKSNAVFQLFFGKKYNLKHYLICIKSIYWHQGKHQLVGILCIVCNVSIICNVGQCYYYKCFISVVSILRAAGITCIDFYVISLVSVAL